jgi:regulator of nucleoside diphosphate kinase
MRRHDTLITSADHRRLRSLAARLRRNGRGHARHLAALGSRMRGSRIVGSRDVPRNVVTLNSRVTLKDLDSGKRVSCSLSDPHEVGLFGAIRSAAAPPGIALLGKRVGQVVRKTLGSRVRRFRIERILYQPEAAGDWHL